MTRGVFLDRDGVLNDVDVEGGVSRPPPSADQVRLLPGVRDACARLRAAGYPLVVVTNQPDVARGHQAREKVEAINDLIRRELPVQDVLTCYHDDGDGCDCRKPKPGLLVRAARRWGIDLAGAFMVGDRWSDVEAGRAAGCRTILIHRPYSRRECCRPDWVVADLAEAGRLILAAGDGT